ncbi:class I SAM-dependent methyltransferase [Chthonobacter albigriseus]|uniref:class I SAM-dependent methyltransferase n=1 Tax=Chthonobacter albigriseus TaxID=1683161 RepID=UPI0019D62C39|nr:class I SAM-dependent methyltransferase [Chthonobacter albigriseus]
MQNSQRAESDHDLYRDYVRKDEVAGLVRAAIVEMFGLFGSPNDGADLRRVARLAAAVDSVNYAVAEMAGAREFQSTLDILTDAMQRRRSGGMILEFGVFSGKTINHMASLTDEPVFGFDSFEGLPEDWRPDYRKGAFKTALPQVAPNVELVVGWFNKTLPDFLDRHPQPISVLHVDCDLYASTKTIFDACRDRIVPGTVIVFDEYFNYVGWRRHEYKMFQEFIASTGLKYRYLGYVPMHQQASVVIL